MPHATTVFDLEKHGVPNLEASLRNLPVDGTIKLLHSGLALTRVAGGRRFALQVPPKVTERLSVKVDQLKSASLAAQALSAAHHEVLRQLDLVQAEAEEHQEVW